MAINKILINEARLAGVSLVLGWWYGMRGRA